MAGRCLVCHLITNKTGLHYGALTCYPCRAFFRRAQTRKRELLCKKVGNCELDGQLKKFCPSCRYRKCIQVGMKPELVLKEEEISERFKYKNIGKNSRISYDSNLGITQSSRLALNLEGMPSTSTTSHDIFSNLLCVHTENTSEPPMIEEFQRVSVIKRVPCNYNKDNNTEENISEGNEDEEETLICDYIHKKFRKLDSIKADLRDDLNKSKQPFIEVKLDLYKNNHLSNENIRHMDSKFLEEMNQIFTKSFSAINLGEAVMESYIQFCIKKSNGDPDLELAPNFYSACNLQITKKFLNFVAHYDFLNIPSDKLYTLLKKNLPRVRCLFYVFQYNNISVEEELKLGCGETDLKQWSKVPDRPPGVPFSEMVTFIKMDPDTKLGLIKCLLELCHPTFRDKTVFILTFLLGLLDFEDVEEVKNLRQTVLLLIQRYLSERLYSDHDMKNIGFTLSRLPYLMDIVT